MLRSFIRRLARIDPRRFRLLVVLMVALGLLDGAGAALLIPVLQALGVDMHAGGAGRVGWILNWTFEMVGLRTSLVATLAAYVAVICGYALLYRWQTMTIFRLQANFMVTVREQLYRSITYSNWAFYSRQRSSDFAHALTVEVNRVGWAVQYLLQLAGTGALLLAYLALAFLLSWQATAIALVSGALLIGSVRPRARLAGGLGTQFSRASEELHSAVSEHLAGMKLVRGYNEQEPDIQIFSWLSSRLRSLYLSAIEKQASTKAWLDIGTALMLALLLLAARLVFNLPSGTLLILLFLFARLLPRFSSFQQQYQMVATSLPALAAIDRIRAECEASSQAAAEPRTSVDLRAEIRLADVSFSYETGRPPALEHVTIAIPVGQTTAIVGSSGSGKTTIGDLVLGLLTPTSGRVLIDGVPLTSARLASWRSQIGYVDQETFLFHGSLRANLLWSSPGASHDQVGEALRMSAADEFVARLPDGLETVVGDRGVRLSGGERQRLALARALLRRPSLLILDEATSELDYESERRIWTAIDGLHHRTTILVITHRLATVQTADVIHVLDHGRVAESGDWHSLTGDSAGRLVALWQAAGQR